MTPLWLLDVDGVINAVSHPVPIGYQTIMVPAGRAEWPITYRKDVVDFIGEMHASGKVEVRWLTTWCDDAKNNLAPALGLPEFKVEGLDDFAGARRVWWKSITAQRLVSQDPERPMIWTDDDLDYGIRNRECDWLDQWGGLRCLISPNSQMGLMDDQLEQILEFATLVKGA